MVNRAVSRLRYCGARGYIVTFWVDLFSFVHTVAVESANVLYFLQLFYMSGY